MPTQHLQDIGETSANQVLPELCHLYWKKHTNQKIKNKIKVLAGVRETDFWNEFDVCLERETLFG